ncbi:hypothetical protein JRO89_XS09G0119300 [Xanthoceras sorbifolium]|uniref:Gag1-like clamp domain-containing protein n=1 Tax=Xanthoceras sorbifolium TaxID=99658 RepID=A0ABQ8HL22_9ROSI|nr:hypothetical protein JRO89_XS09G0119300 [Xanthoceras sorbifolium]
MRNKTFCVIVYLSLSGLSDLSFLKLNFWLQGKYFSLDLFVAFVWFLYCMHGSSGCLGCYTKPKLVNSANQPSKELRVQGHTSKKPSLLEDFWTTSTCDMDNSAVQSQGSISSIGANNLTLDTGGAGSASGPSEFVNHGNFSCDVLLAGLLLWNQTRQRWIGNKRSENGAQQVREPKLKPGDLKSMLFGSTHCLCMVKKFWLCSWNATYDSLLGSNKPFPQPIPLSEMVDFLVDIWEQEGMYD